MSQSIGKDSLQAILASKMAEFNSAMNKIQAAETEAIFADFSAKRSEQRMNEFLSSMSGFDSIKQTSSSITNYMDSVTVAGAIARYNSILSRVSNLQAEKSQMESEIKTESFNILNESLISMKQGVEGLNEKISNCDDPAIKAKLIAKKEQLQTFISRGEEIQKIENNEEAMKAFYEYAKDSYIAFNPNKDKYTEEELQKKLQSTKPKENSVIGYFEGIKGVWDLYKGDMAELKSTIGEASEQAKEQNAKIKAQEEELNKQQQELDKRQAEISEKAGTLGVITKTFKTVSTVTQPLSIPLSLGLKVLEKVIEPEQDAQEIQKTEKMEEDVEKLQKSQEDLNKQQEELNNKLTGLKLKQANLQEQVEKNDKVVNKFSRLENVAPKIDNMMTDAHHNIDVMITRRERKLKEMSEISRDVSENEVVSISNTSISDQIKKKDSYESLIEKENDKMISASSTIFDLNGDLKKSDIKKEEKTENLLKQTDQAKFLKENNPQKKESFINKLCSFIRNSADSETKVVIDRSLSDLYDDLAGDFGTERVVVDKRQGDRRSGDDRRLLANKQQQADVENPRTDTSGRRNADKRAGNHIFISEDTIRKLDLNS